MLTDPSLQAAADCLARDFDQVFGLGQVAGRQWARRRARLPQLRRLAILVDDQDRLFAWLFPNHDRHIHVGETVTWEPFLRLWCVLQGKAMNDEPSKELKTAAWRWWYRLLPREHYMRQGDHAFLHGWAVGAVAALRSAWPAATAVRERAGALTAIAPAATARNPARQYA